MEIIVCLLRTLTRGSTYKNGSLITKKFIRLAGGSTCRNNNNHEENFRVGQHARMVGQHAHESINKKNYFAAVMPTSPVRGTRNGNF